MANLKTAFENSLKPGDVIAISMGIYKHWAIVSDRRCPRGKPMLISATNRNGTVAEERYDIVVSDKAVNYAPVKPDLPAHQILANARSQIGSWHYRLFTGNCEHFANWVCGLSVSSRQVNHGIAGAFSFALIAKLVAKDPKPVSLVLMACAGAAVGVSMAQLSKEGA